MTKSGNDKFLVDGFPRNANNLEGWEKVMGDKVDVKFMLFLECTEEVSQQYRWRAAKSGGAALSTARR